MPRNDIRRSERIPHPNPPRSPAAPGGEGARKWLAVLALLAATPAYAQQAVTLDPQGSGAITGALAWMQGTLMGSVATTVAVIAVAAVGLMMLSGRINWRFGATVVLGLFILFGASAIVGGIRSTASQVQ